MKKIMKRALSLMLVFAMMLVPMTSMAATGDDVAMPSICIYSGETVTVDAGATTYFEVGGMGNFGTYEFIVEGTGDFDVAVCTEGSPYKEGTAISATSGKVETEITFFESTYGYGAASITNNTSASVDYTITVVFPEGTQSNPKALTLAVGSTANVTVPAGGQYYINAKLPSAGVEYNLTITGNTGFGYVGMTMPAWDTDGVYTTTVAAYNAGAIASFSIANKTDSDITCTLALTEIVKELGDESNPDTLPMNTTTTKELDGNEYWYTWTATEAGTLKITMDNEKCTNGWTYKATCGDITKHFSTGWDESDKNVCQITVAAGDIVNFGISVPKYYEGIGYDVYNFGNGTVEFTTSFVAGETNPDDGNNSGNGGTGTGGDSTTGTKINDTYYYSNQALSVGSNEIMAEFGYPTTLYKFVSNEAGEYTVTINVESALLGCYGTNEWFPYDSTENKTSTLTFEYKEAGAPCLIGVSNALNAIVTITKAGDVQEEETLAWTEYENKNKPSAFEFTGDANKLEYVDIEDSIVDKAVLGDDGYYHLNDANGPILFVALNATYGSINLIDAMGYGQLKQIVSENGEVVAKFDYNTAFNEYVTVADADTMLYPLTEDLIAIYQNVGESQLWYGENGWVGGTAEDAWMFACCYQEGLTTLKTNTNTNTNGTTNNTTTGNTSTGDHANVAVWAIVMVVAAGAAFVVAESKRRAR